MVEFIRRAFGLAFGGVIERRRKRDRIHRIFQSGHQVVHLKSGRVFDVINARYDGAFLRDVKSHRVRLVIWVRPALTFNYEVADQWDAYPAMQVVPSMQTQEEVPA